MAKRIKSFEHTARVGFSPDGQDISIEFDRTTRWEDDAYEGFRGFSVEKDVPSNITVDDKPLDALSSLEEAEVRRLVDAYLQENEPEIPEQPERDWDRVRDEQEGF